MTKPVQEPDKCLECDGTGTVIDAPAYGDCHVYWTACPECGGTGLAKPAVTEELEETEKPDAV